MASNKTLPPMSPIEIRPAVLDCTQAYINHLVKHISESGQEGLIYVPFSRNSCPDLSSLFERLKINWMKEIDQPEWERTWVVWQDKKIVGHIDLRGNSLEAAKHRCFLGMGLDSELRGLGIGRQLLEIALNWARSQDILDWVDLYVFEHNKVALKLYEAYGFETIGIIKDMFRIEEEMINDIHMCLKLNKSPRSYG